MDANLMINIVAGLAVLDVTACLGYNLYMLKKYSDGPCGKYAIDFLPCSMLLKIAVILLLLMICYAKYVHDHDFLLPLILLIAGLISIADMIASRVEFLIDAYKQSHFVKRRLRNDSTRRFEAFFFC